MTLVTLDFHNTLFTCDRWFQLEIEHLPCAVLESLTATSGLSVSSDDVEQARAIYRDIRKEAMRSGVERDAETSIIQVLDALNITADEASIRTAVREVMWDSVDEARPRCDAVELVRSVGSEGIPLAVVSSAAYHPFLEWCLERFDMRSAFTHVVTSAECGIYKSNPEIYRHTLRLFDADPEQSVHIGDSHRFDVTSASTVGMRTILLTDDVDQLYEPAPDAIVRSLGEARPHLDRLLSN